MTKKYTEKKSFEIHNYEQEVEIVNPWGIHARPAALFTKVVEGYESKVEVCYNGKMVSGSNGMGLMTLEASLGAKITIRVSGNGDAETCRDELVALVKAGFNEMDEK